MLRVDASDLLNWQGLDLDSLSDESSINFLNDELEEGFQGKVRKTFARKSAVKWTKPDEEVLKAAFGRYNAENPSKPAYSSPCINYEPTAVSVIAGYPEVVLLDRNVKQIREKWINTLCPNSLGSTIKRAHKPIIEAIHKNYPNNQWEEIAEIFAREVLEDKPWGEYYSNNTIKNYFMNFVNRPKNRYRPSIVSDPNVHAIKEVAKDPFTPKIIKKWSQEEEDAVRDAFIKYNNENPEEPAYSGPCQIWYNSSAFSTIAKYLEDTLPEWTRNSKQIREKWINDLCPNSLGTQIKLPAHQQIIQELHQEYGNRWVKIEKIFAERIIPDDKAWGQYYSNNAIKNFCLHPQKRKRDQYEGLGSFNLNTHSAEEAELQNRVSVVFTRKIARGWSKAEEAAVIKAALHYNNVNPKKPVYSSPSVDNYNCFAFFMIAKYLQNTVPEWNKNSKQIREKWINELCPNSLGSSIQLESHQEIIKELYKEHGNQWAKIERIFADRVLPGSKDLGQYYSTNTIKNYCGRAKKTAVDLGNDSTDKDTISLLDLSRE